MPKAGLIHPPSYMWDAPMLEAGLIYPPSYMWDTPMLDAGLIYPPLKKGGRGDLPGRQGALWNLTKAKPSQIPLVPPFTKGDAPMLEAGLIYPLHTWGIRLCLMPG